MPKRRARSKRRGRQLPPWLRGPPRGGVGGKKAAHDQLCRFKVKGESWVTSRSSSRRK